MSLRLTVWVIPCGLGGILESAASKVVNIVDHGRGNTGVVENVDVPIGDANAPVGHILRTAQVVQRHLDRLTANSYGATGWARRFGLELEEDAPAARVQFASDDVSACRSWSLPALGRTWPLGRPCTAHDGRVPTPRRDNSWRLPTAA